MEPGLREQLGGEEGRDRIQEEQRRELPRSFLLLALQLLLVLAEAELELHWDERRDRLVGGEDGDEGEDELQERREEEEQRRSWERRDVLRSREVES